MIVVRLDLEQVHLVTLADLRALMNERYVRSEPSLVAKLDNPAQAGA
jgi:hypothetical protein